MNDRDQFESAFRNLHKNQSERSLDILLEWYNHGTEEEPDWGYYSLAARDAFLWWQASREALKAEQEGAWIACSERMPEIGANNWRTPFPVLVKCEMGVIPAYYGFSWHEDEKHFGFMESLRYGDGAGCSPEDHNNGLMSHVSHWQPLPAPPSQTHPIDTTSQQYETLAKGEVK